MSENRLGHETSPYLLQHKDNPVHWWAWGPEALAEAKRTGKPILLSVGYAACHWCHVMAHESFEDEATAAVMNELFVNIKVDREERPDIDAIYMGALHALGEQGGWPLTMFLDSEARPVWGGTYFPKDEPLRPAGLRRRPAPRRARLPRRARQGRRERAPLTAAPAGAAAPSLGALADRRPAAARTSRSAWSPRRRSGARRPARRAEVSAVELLLAALARRHPLRRRAGARAPSIRTLANICQGGIYDHLGGGFARYSVDERWLVPHFEKMLYDNALLLELLTEVWRETRLATVQGAHRRDGRLARARDDRRGRRLRRLARRRLARARKASSTSGRLRRDPERARRRGRPLLRAGLRRHAPTATGKATRSSTGSRRSQLRSDAEEQRLAGCAPSCSRRAASACAPAGTTRCSPTGTG